jgi:sulfur-carrier protein
MAKVRIPQPLRALTNDDETAEVSGKNVRQIIDALEQLYPGVKAALLKDEKLRPDIAIMLDNRIAQLGLLEPVSEDAQLLFIPAIGGG